MHQAKSGRCRFVDQNLGRTALSGRKGILVEVEHVKAHGTKKEKKEMSHFQKFVTEGNKKADELAKEGALLGDGFSRNYAAGKRGRVGSLAVCGQLPLLSRRMEGLKTSSQSRKKSGVLLTRGVKE